MKNTTIPEPVGFNELTKPEQIRYLQSLWDRIAENPEELPVPASHMELVEERLAAYRRDPSQEGPAEEVLDRLSKRNR